MFPYLHLWNDFARRASYVASMGHAVPDVLLYNPIESAWIQADAEVLDVNMWSFPEDHPGGKRINEIEKVYAKAIDDLTTARVEFLIGDQVEKWRFEEENLKVGKTGGEPAIAEPLTVALDIALIQPDKTWELKVENYAKYKPCEQELTVPFEGDKPGGERAGDAGRDGRGEVSPDSESQKSNK
jgi:hypothetical protein